MGLFSGEMTTKKVNTDKLIDREDRAERILKKIDRLHEEYETLTSKITDTDEDTIDRDYYRKMRELGISPRIKPL